MEWRDIWIDGKTNRVRSGWRVLAFLGVALFAQVMLLLLFTDALPNLKSMGKYQNLFELILEAVATTPAVLGTALWALRTFDRLPAHTLGLSMADGWSRLLLAGLAIGTGMSLVIMLALWASGIATVHWQVSEPRVWLSVLLITGLMFISAVSEELLARGYLFQTLLRGIGPLLTLLLTSLGFMALHLPNPHTTPIGLTNIFLAGLLSGLLYLRSGSLWAPIGLHAGWNIGILLFGVPISGITIPLETPFQTLLAGPRLIAGGAFGPEGSVVASVVLLGAIAFLAYARVGLPLDSRWWEWRGLTAVEQQPRNWDFSIDDRHYQWKMADQEQQEG